VKKGVNKKYDDKVALRKNKLLESQARSLKNIENAYLRKVAQTLSASGSSSTTVSSGGGSGKGFSTLPNAVAGADRAIKPMKLSSRMGPHTTPDDILPNPTRMDMRVEK